MVRQIVIEPETPGDSRTMFRLRIDASLIADDLTAVQAHVLAGEILERITLSKSSEGASPIADSDAAMIAPAPSLGRSRLRANSRHAARPRGCCRPKDGGTPHRLQAVFLNGEGGVEGGAGFGHGAGDFDSASNDPVMINRLSGLRRRSTLRPRADRQSDRRFRPRLAL
jgi:hypothetical protein